MEQKQRDYFNLSRVISIILAIIPITSWICGCVTRFAEHNPVAGIIRIFLGFNILWLVDLVFMIAKGSIIRLLDK